jgi:hypothetical protein
MESKEIRVLSESQYKFMEQFDKCDCDEYAKLYEKCIKIINSTEEKCIDEVEKIKIINKKINI